MWGVKQILLICALVALVGCSQTVEIDDPIVEKAIRSFAVLNKPTGELTEADLAKAHSGLNPVREQVQELEKEHEEMNSQIESETAKQHTSWKLPRKNG